MTSLVMLLAASSSVLWGERPSDDDAIFFENKIRPVLVKHCYECHAADAKDVGSKLLLDSRSGIRTGGESGPALVEGKPDEMDSARSARSSRCQSRCIPARRADCR